MRTASRCTAPNSQATGTRSWASGTGGLSCFFITVLSPRTQCFAVCEDFVLNSSSSTTDSGFTDENDIVTREDVLQKWAPSQPFECLDFPGVGRRAGFCNPLDGTIRS